MTRRTRPRSATIATLAFGCAAMLLPVSPSGAETVILQNDSVVDFGQAVVQAGFVTDERAAAWLTSTCDGDLVAVQVLWLSLTGTGQLAIGHSISVSEAGTFPNLGTELVHLSAPLMTDGVFNEFAIVPGVPLSAGETVVVDFRFDESPPVIGPSVVTDANGCQAGKNGIYAIPPGFWFDSCLLGVSGDFAIRAVVNCPDGNIFADGYESGNTSAWSDTVP